MIYWFKVEWLVYNDWGVSQNTFIYIKETSCRKIITNFNTTESIGSKMFAPNFAIS